MKCKQEKGNWPDYFLATRREFFLDKREKPHFWWFSREGLEINCSRAARSHGVKNEWCGKLFLESLPHWRRFLWAEKFLCLLALMSDCQATTKSEWAKERKIESFSLYVQKIHKQAIFVVARLDEKRKCNNRAEFTHTTHTNFVQGFQKNSINFHKY